MVLVVIVCGIIVLYRGLVWFGSVWFGLVCAWVGGCRVMYLQCQSSYSPTPTAPVSACDRLSGPPVSINRELAGMGGMGWDGMGWDGMGWDGMG